jgi:hypothetical protein
VFEPIEQNLYLSEVAEDILHSPFLTKEFCQTLFDFAKDFDNWTTNRADFNYSTHDCHLKTVAPVFYDIISDALDEALFPRVAKWWQVNPFEVSDMFIVKYSEQTQTKLSYHHDQSYISSSIKLNDNYSGGVLNFPHKNYDNSSLSVGDIIFWPSQVTHLHGSSSLTSGEKYSITIWTKPCTE